MKHTISSLLFCWLSAAVLHAGETASGFHDTPPARRLLAIAREYLPADWRYPVTDRGLSEELQRELTGLLPLTVRAQPNDYSCGPTSLAMLLSQHGRTVSNEQLARDTRLTEDGVDPEQLVTAAEGLGFQVSARYNAAVSDIVAALQAERPVMIDFQASYEPGDKPKKDAGHYSVVVASDDRDLLIVDCSTPNPHHLRRIPRDSLAAIWWDTYIDETRDPNRFERWMMTITPRPALGPPAMSPLAMNLLDTTSAQ